MSEQVNFTISTGLKNIIGKELITDDFIAIFELVKNSYDAQAENVWIVFKDIESDNGKNGRIIVIDDGYGMSRSDIDNKWLFVGYSEKRYVENFRDKIGKRRIFSGAKGIGRFSCDRLSRYLYLYTKIEDEKNVHKLCVNWDLFEADSQEEFQTINIEYDKIKKIEMNDVNIESIMNKKFISGAILELVDLNEGWDRDKLIKLKRHLQRLVNPVQIREDDEFSIHLVAEEFLEGDDELKENKNEDEIEYHNIINGLVKNVVFEQLTIKTIRIEVEIGENGSFVTSRLYDKNKKIYEIKENLEKGKYPSLHNIKINLFYLNRTAKSTFTRLMGLRPVEFGSIFLYKNGFRISPYGNEGDDWLGLDRRKLQSYNRRLANRELIGRIEIWGTQDEFQEVSSRDGGVIKTPAFAELKEFFVRAVIERLEKYVVEGINWDNPDAKPKTQQEINIDSLKIIHNIIGNYDKSNVNVEFHPDLLEIYEEKQISSVPRIIDNIQQIKKSLDTKEEKEYVDLQTKSIRNAFRSMMDRQKQLEKEIKQTERQALFSKYVVGEDKKEIMGLQHQIGISADTIRGLLDDLKIVYLDKGKDIPNVVMKDYMNSILIQVESIYSISQFVTKTKFDLEARKIREDIIKYISDYIERIYKLYNEKEIVNRELEIKIKNEKNSKYVCDFSSLDFMIVVDNLIDNSIKANSSLIEFNFNVINENQLNIHVKDNGEGIPVDNHDKIFNFGFTTTGGSGIGLNQVKKIMEEYGDITTNKNVKIGAEFILEVKK